MPEEEHLFTSHSNPKLTFIVGIVIGVFLMTLTGTLFFVYALIGGELQTYELEPLDTGRSLLEEPVGEIQLAGEATIVVDESTHVFGATENYTVTLVQYLDYECRFCKKFYPEVKQLVDDNADKIRFVVKQYPLTKIHPYSKSSAVAAECAGQQDKFLEYTQYLFDHQSELSGTLYDQAASELGLDSEQFITCQESAEIVDGIVDRIETDTFEAQHLGIVSQPNLVVWRESDGMEQESMQLIDGYVNRGYLESVLADSL